MTARRAHVHVAPSARAWARAEGGDPFDALPPPLGLRSDMVLAVGTCQAEPLQRAFPGVPFAVLGGRAFLGTWFARVEELRSSALPPAAEPWGRGAGRPPVHGDVRRATRERPAGVPYLELNVAFLLRDGRLFVAGIYATSDLSSRLGHRYGMPKRRIAMSYAADARGAASRTRLGAVVGGVRARALTDGRGLATVLSWLLPAWTVPVAFPSGSWIEARLDGVERARLAWLVERRLALDEVWLPRPASLWPLALHVVGQRMTLPAEVRP